jgi:hypothetical protein
LLRFRREDRSAFGGPVGPSMIDSPTFNFDPPSRALPETQNDIRFSAHQCIDELFGDETALEKRVLSIRTAAAGF